MSPLQYCNRASWRMKVLGIWVALSALTSSANAEELAVSLDARVWITQADGSRRAAAVQRASPGDLIEYRVTYRNTGQRLLKQVQATLPVPPNTTLADAAHGGTSPLPPSASRDGQGFEASPLREPVRQPDGSVQWRESPLSAYRALRWPLGDLAAGKSKTVTAFVRVLRDAPDEVASASAAPALAPSTVRRQP